MRARVLVRRGRLKDAIVTICATLLGASVLIVLLQPALRATRACIPLLAVALALPYLSGRALRVLIASALATTVVVVCCGELMPSASHLPAWFVATFHTSSLTATIALVLLLLWQFSSRLTATLSRTQAAGQVYRVVGIAEDITGPRQIAEALNVAKNAAESANLAKSEFLATMSHELRTPMNGVITMIEMLLATQLTAKQREYADIIRLSGDGLLRLINDSLDFSRIEAGKLDLAVDTFDLRALLDEVTSMTRPRALNQGLKLRTSVDSSVPAQLCGDGYRLRQVLLNLVSNAVKFTERNDPGCGG